MLQWNIAFEQSLAVLCESVMTVNVSRLGLCVLRLPQSQAAKSLADIIKQLDVKSHTQSMRLAPRSAALPPGRPAHYSSRSGWGDAFFSCTEEAQYPVPAKRSNAAQSRLGPWPSQGPERGWNQSHRLSGLVIYEVCVHLYLRLLKACYCLTKRRDLMGQRDGSRLSSKKKKRKKKFP